MDEVKDDRRIKLIDMGLANTISQEIIGVMKKYELNTEEMKFIIRFLMEGIEGIANEIRKMSMMEAKMKTFGGMFDRIKEKFDEENKKRDL